jgi:glycosyltransferase involved in cell wall biosynthesis
MRRRRTALRPLLEVEARRTRRDEIRCVGAASSVAYLSDDEIEALGEHAPGPRLDLVLPPAPKPAPLSAPVALFVGDRRWAPNREALERLLRLWPEVVQRQPQARLVIAGGPGSREREPDVPGVERLGFVDDLEAVWSSAAVLLAPVTIGGGVRVKVLDAARHGVPVVGTPEAIGSTAAYLPVSPQAGSAELVELAAELLGDSAERKRRGEALYEANRDLNRRGFVQEQVARLLGVVPPAGSEAPDPERAGNRILGEAGDE